MQQGVSASNPTGADESVSPGANRAAAQQRQQEDRLRSAGTSPGLMPELQAVLDQGALQQDEAFADALQVSSWGLPHRSR